MSADRVSADELWKKARAKVKPHKIHKKDLAEIIAAFIEEGVSGQVRIPAGLALEIMFRFSLPYPGETGRPPNTLQANLEIDAAIKRGRKRKAELIAKGMRKSEAHETVADELHKELNNKSFNGSLMTVSKDRIRQRLYGSK